MAKMQLILKRNKKDEITTGILRNVPVYYTKVQRPVAIYEQRKEKNPTKLEYTVDVGVSEEIADQFDEVFEKQQSKKLTNAKFKERFRLEDDDLPLPCPKEKKQFVLKLKQAAQKNDGTKLPKALRPRVVEKDENGKPVDITFKKLVGNGSTADIMFRVNQNDFGTFAYLSTVLVTDLNEYEAGGDAERDEFLGGSLDLDDDEDEDEGNSGGSSNSDKGDDDDYSDDDDAPIDPEDEEEEDDEEYM